jgi:hypothetical protein
MNRQEELEGMSDFKLNCILATLLGYLVNEEQTQALGFVNGVICNSEWVKDFCGTPEDIMPLAIKNKVYFRESGELGGKIMYEAHRFISSGLIYISADLNPYRAICIVIILMKEAENEVAS